MDAKSGEVLSRVGVEAVPRGITLEQDTLGKPKGMGFECGGELAFRSRCFQSLPISD